MIDLSQFPPASPRVHSVPSDPGRSWIKDVAVAVDAPPDAEANPSPEAQWPRQAQRSGVCGAVSPRVLALREGGFRMYYTQILPRNGFPAGANDYDNAASRILSAVSQDGSAWTPEPGVRLSSQEGGAGEFRVASSEVVPAEQDGRLRMYYECCPGPQSQQNSIRSAVSSDGLTWTPEAGARFEGIGCNYASPRIVLLEDGRRRLYCFNRGQGIISALSEDGGLTFRQEAGVRIAQDGAYDSHAAFASEIVRLDDAGYVMYYAGYGAPNRAYILRAVSDDGLLWRKEAEPVIAPASGGWDSAKCSEMCVFRLPSGEGKQPTYRMVYEACDGTSKNERGVWRIVGATSAPRQRG